MQESEGEFVPDYEEASTAKAKATAKQTATVTATATAPPGLEVILESGPLTRQRSRKEKSVTCILCPNQPAIVGKFRRHLQFHHLPWYYEPQMACWHHRQNFAQMGALLSIHRQGTGCKQGHFGRKEFKEWLALMANFLNYVAKQFHLPSSSELVSLIVERRWHPEASQGVTVPVVTSQLWQELDKFLGTSSPVTYKVDPPQSLAAVLHGGVMMHLLFNMPSDNARSIRGFEEAAVTSWPRYLENYYSGPLLDSHCHLATTMKRYDVKDLHRLKWGSIDFQGEGTKVPVIISNAVHPECWRRYRELESLPGVSSPLAYIPW